MLACQAREDGVDAPAHRARERRAPAIALRVVDEVDRVDARLAARVALLGVGLEVGVLDQRGGGDDLEDAGARRRRLDAEVARRALVDVAGVDEQPPGRGRPSAPRRPPAGDGRSSGRARSAAARRRGSGARSPRRRGAASPAASDAMRGEVRAQPSDRPVALRGAGVGPLHEGRGGRARRAPTGPSWRTCPPRRAVQMPIVSSDALATATRLAIAGRARIDPMMCHGTGPLAKKRPCGLADARGPRRACPADGA